MSRKHGVETLRFTADGREIYRLRGAIGCNVYLIRWGREAVLIDCGFYNDIPKIQEKIMSLLGGAGRLSTILLTHYHKDHCEGAARLAKEMCAEILISEEDAKVFSGEKPYISLPVEMSETTKRFLEESDMWRESLKAGTDWYPKEYRTIKPGDTYMGFDCLSFPGHTEGILCLHDPKEKILFSSDYLIYPRQGLPQFFKKFIHSVNVNQEQAMMASRELIKLQPDCILPGHGEPLIMEATAQLRDSDLYSELFAEISAEENA